MQDDIIDYKQGIRFECQGSGKCCVSRNSYGFVYLSNIDLKRLSNFFKITLSKFKDKYCQITDGFIHLTEKSELDGNCVFLRDKKCSVYTNRPSQCRSWPFWNDNMKAKIWNKDIAVNCPGVGKGKLIKKKEIDRLLKEDFNNEKIILKERINLPK